MIGAIGALGVLVVVAARIDLPYYAIAPGDATAVDPRITVPAGLSHPVHGKVLLADVLLSRETLLSYLPDRLSSDTDVRSAGEILGPATSPGDLVAQEYLEMATSRSAAEAAALRRMGYQVTVTDDGTLVTSVQPGSPASPAVRVGEVITAVGAAATPDACALLGALATHAPGNRVSLTVERLTVTDHAVARPGPVVQVRVRLGRSPRPARPAGCPAVAGPVRAYLGVGVETHQRFAFPIAVSVDTSDIGGPSAGLAMALGIIDRLSGGDLTGGAVVAATGTIDLSGQVGDVGGVAQKTVAVERAGATVFLVPPPEYKVARARAGPSLQVVAVASLEQALGVLARLGGHVPPTIGVAAPGGANRGSATPGS
jgi:PDZ domain-containing protein